MIKLTCDCCGQEIKDIPLAMLAWNGTDNPDFKILHHYEESPEKAMRQDGCYLHNQGYKWDAHLFTLLCKGGFQECLGILQQYHVDIDKAVNLLMRLYGKSVRPEYNEQASYGKRRY